MFLGYAVGIALLMFILWLHFSRAKCPWCYSRIHVEPVHESVPADSRGWYCDYCCKEWRTWR